MPSAHLRLKGPNLSSRFSPPTQVFLSLPNLDKQYLLSHTLPAQAKILTLIPLHSSFPIFTASQSPTVSTPSTQLSLLPILLPIYFHFSLNHFKSLLSSTFATLPQHNLHKLARGSLYNINCILPLSC